MAYIILCIGLAWLIWITIKPRRSQIKVASIYIWQRLCIEQQGYIRPRQWAWHRFLLILIYLLLWLTWQNANWYALLFLPKDSQAQNITSPQTSDTSGPIQTSDTRQSQNSKPQPVHIWITPFAPECLQRLPEFIPGLTKSNYETCDFALHIVHPRTSNLSGAARNNSYDNSPPTSNPSGAARNNSYDNSPPTSNPSGAALNLPTAYLLLARRGKYHTLANLNDFSSQQNATINDFQIGEILISPRTLTAADSIMTAVYPDLWPIPIVSPAKVLPSDSQILLATAQGPIMAYGKDWLYLGFDPATTAWPRLPSFPVFWQNLWNTFSPNRPKNFSISKPTNLMPASQSLTTSQPPTTSQSLTAIQPPNPSGVPAQPTSIAQTQPDIESSTQPLKQQTQPDIESSTQPDIESPSQPLKQQQILQPRYWLVFVIIFCLMLIWIYRY